MIGARAKQPAPRPLTATAAAASVLFAAPFAYVVWRNLQLGSDLWWGELWSRSILAPLGRSVWLGLTVSGAAVAVGTGLAWLTTRTDLPGRRVWRVLAPLPLVFPSFVGATALLAGFASGGMVEQLLAPLGVGTLPNMRGFFGAWLVLTLFTYPYVYLPTAARLAVTSRSLEESARLLGRKSLGVFVSVVIPQASGAVMAGGLLVFLYVISDFGAVTLLGYDTLTDQIYADRLFDQPRAMALALVLGLTALVVVAAERWTSRRRPVVEAAEVTRPETVGLGRWKWPASAAVAAFLANALIGPLAVLGWWAWRGLRADVESVGLRTDAAALVVPMLRSAAVSVTTAVAAIAVVLPVAWLTARYRSRIGGWANATMVAGFALPGLVIALSVVFFALNTPVVSRWYQTLPLLVTAYVIHFGAHAVRATRVAVDANPVSLGEAATILGSGRVRRLVAVDLPLMAPGLAAGAGLVLLSTIKELPVTLLLAPIGFDTLAKDIWDAVEIGALSQAGLASLVLVGAAAVLTAATSAFGRLSRRRSRRRVRRGPAALRTTGGAAAPAAP